MDLFAIPLNLAAPLLVQWWPYLQSSGGQSQLPFLSSSARHKSASAASGGLVGALRSLTFSVPASSQWPPLMHEWALVSCILVAHCMHACPSDSLLMSPSACLSPRLQIKSALQRHSIAALPVLLSADRQHLA